MENKKAPGLQGAYPMRLADQGGWRTAWNMRAGLAHY
jgi:hypothetical protein